MNPPEPPLAAGCAELVEAEPNILVEPVPAPACGCEAGGAKRLGVEVVVLAVAGLKLNLDISYQLTPTVRP